MKLSKRKSRLAFTTEATSRYKRKDREIVVEVFPHTATLRLSGTRTRYEVSWRAVFDLAAEIFARQERERRKAARAAKRAHRF